MRPWSDFYDLALPDLPGCPLGALDQALRQSAIAFCEQSLAWRYVHPDIAVVAGTASYPFAPPEGAVVHVITYAKFGDVQIAVAKSEFDLRYSDWRDQSGTPACVLGGLDSLTLVPNPDVAGVLKLIVALKPSPDAAGIDEGIFNEDREAIVHGALERLMLSPKKPYTSASLAVYHQQRFAVLTAGAGLRVARHYTRAPLRSTIMRR